MLDIDKLIAVMDTMASRAGSYYRLAKEWRITRQELSAVRNQDRQPPKRLLEKMGYEAVTMYRKKGKP